MANRRLPKRIRVLGRWFGIEVVSGLIESQEADATLDLKNNVIRVDRSWRQDYRRECILHEVNHAIVQLLDINPKTEAGHRILSIVLDAVFSDNPSFVGLYKGKEE